MTLTGERKGEQSLIKLPRHQLTFFLLLAVSLGMVGWRPLFDTFALALRNDAYTHILLILPISAALILLEWRSLRSTVTPNVGTGCALLAMAVLVAGFAREWSASLPSDVRLLIQMLALVLSWMGAFVLCFGARAFRSFLFPLCFLFWLVPLPAFVLNGIVSLLQQGSAYAADLLFSAARVPVEKDGVLLSIPGLTMEVARDCSSIRSSMILWVTTMVLAQLLLCSPWRKALLILVSIPLAVAKNGLRIFAIAMLTTRVDPTFMTGQLHHDGGIAFFMFSLIAVFVLIWMLRRAEGHVPAKAA